MVKADRYELEMNITSSCQRGGAPVAPCVFSRTHIIAGDSFMHVTVRSSQTILRQPG
jgi:hypothetical protein